MRLSGVRVGGSRWCGACRAAILRSFTSVSGLQQQRPQPPASPSSLTLRRCPPQDLGIHSRGLQVRWFSIDSSLKSLSTSQDVEGQIVDGVEESGMNGDDNEDRDSESSSIEGQQIPWYLQVSGQQQDTPRLLSDRQRIPDLPDHPPPLLQPLLRYVSVELGLDDLTLLDLRELDPPPALGAYTLMVIGTARGEKHLHVSANRLCGWLHGNHNLRPYADGLLGRNELKLKMRRRTRKTKLLGSRLNGSLSGDADDELRTGWVCVNVGGVESNQAQEHKYEGMKSIVGFGTQTEGVRIVVQMFTEEKRLEMDLEGLWGGLLKESSQRAAWRQDTQGQVELHRPPMSQDHGSMGMHAHLKLPTVPGTHAPNNQTRRVHTSARLSRADVLKVSQSDTESDNVAAMLLPQSATIERKAEEHHHGWSWAPLQEDSKLDLSAERRSAMSLSSLLNDLQNMPRTKARKALGKGSRDFTSTPFLFSFYQTFPTFPTAEHWHCKVQVFCHGIKLAHPGYTKQSLHDLHYAMQLSGADILPETLHLMLEAMLSRNNALSIPAQRGGAATELSEKDLNLAWMVLKDMGNRNIDVLTEEILIIVYESISFPHPVWTHRMSISKNPSPSLPNPETITDSQLQNAQDIQTRLGILMAHYNISFTRDEHIIRLLTLYANQADWSAFFETWALPARQMLPRSPALYAFMFDIVARTKHQMFCMQILRTYIPELDSEDPMVRLEGDVARSVMRCLKRAHPSVKKEAQEVPLVKGEWVRLWRRCATGLQHGKVSSQIGIVRSE